MQEDISSTAPPDFDALFREIHPKLVAFFRRQALLGLDAEDLVQETIFTVFTRYGEWKPAQGSFTTWLFGVARYLQIEFFRRRARELARSEDHEALLAITQGLRETADHYALILRGIGRIVQSAFNALRGRTTFRMRTMAQGPFGTLATHRVWYLFHGAHPPRSSGGSTGNGPVFKGMGRMCSRPVPAV